jgi:glycosyltransferase involved in cell wall biosynthesis
VSKSILYVTPSLGVGGTERHLLLIAKGLRTRGYTISFFCFGPTGPVGKNLIADGFSVNSSPTQNKASLFRGMISLFKQVKKQKPDIVHFFLPKAYIVGAPIVWLAGHRCMMMSRRSLNNYQTKHPFSAWVERFLHKGMTKITGNSMKVIEQLSNDEKVTSDKLHLIYNGVDTHIVSDSFDRTTYRSSLNIDQDSRVFIIIANLIPYKGHVDLLSAFERAKDKLPLKWDLLCVGRDNGIQDQLMMQAQKAGIEHHIHFLNHRDDITELLNCADIGLLVSHEEGFSNAILETMAAGLPLVVTDVGGNSEAVIHGENGLVVPPKDPEALAQALQKIITVKFLPQTNIQRVQTNFSMHACLEAYESLYQNTPK